MGTNQRSPLLGEGAGHRVHTRQPPATTSQVVNMIASLSRWVDQCSMCSPVQLASG